MNKRIGAIIVFISTVVVMLLPVSAKANSNNFSVKIIPTEHQIDDTKSYFDLKLQPEESDILPIEISNNSGKNQKFSITFQKATTNMNGIVDYTLDKVISSGEPQINIRDVVKIETSEISIDANSSQQVTLSVKMPKKSFDGILLGGIKVSQVEDSEDSTRQMVSNKVQYVTAVQIKQTDNMVAPKITAGNINLTQINGQNAVVMSLNNPTATLISKVKGHFQITKKGSKEVLVEQTNDQMSIAPNISFMPFLKFGDKFKPGDYTYTITLKNSDNEWSLSKDFVISKDEAKKYNASSIDESKKIPLWIYIVSGMAIVILILVIVLIKVIKK